MPLHSPHFNPLGPTAARTVEAGLRWAAQYVRLDGLVRIRQHVKIATTFSNDKSWSEIVSELNAKMATFSQQCTREWVLDLAADALRAQQAEYAKYMNLYSLRRGHDPPSLRLGPEIVRTVVRTLSPMSVAAILAAVRAEFDTTGVPAESGVPDITTLSRADVTIAEDMAGSVPPSEDDYIIRFVVQACLEYLSTSPIALATQVQAINFVGRLPDGSIPPTLLTRSGPCSVYPLIGTAVSDLFFDAFRQLGMADPAHWEYIGHSQVEAGSIQGWGDMSWYEHVVLTNLPPFAEAEIGDNLRQVLRANAEEVFYSACFWIVLGLVPFADAEAAKIESEIRDARSIVTGRPSRPVRRRVGRARR